MNRNAPEDIGAGNLAIDRNIRVSISRLPARGGIPVAHSKVPACGSR